MFVKKSVLMIIEDVKMDKDKKKQNWRVPLIIGIVCIVIVILFIIFALQQNYSSSSSTSSDSETSLQNQQSQKSCKDVQVPYEDIEYYASQEPYTDTECQMIPLTYSKNIANCDTSAGFLGLNANKIDCIVTNTDTEAGNFNVRVGFKCSSTTDSRLWDCYSSIQTFFIPSTFSVSAKGTYGDIDAEECFCEVNPSTKQICRDVIKYREVTKTRPVTRYRTEQKCD